MERGTWALGEVVYQVRAVVTQHELDLGIDFLRPLPRSVSRFPTRDKATIRHNGKGNEA